MDAGVGQCFRGCVRGHTARAAIVRRGLVGSGGLGCVRRNSFRERALLTSCATGRNGHMSAATEGTVAGRGQRR